MKRQSVVMLLVGLLLIGAIPGAGGASSGTAEPASLHQDAQTFSDASASNNSTVNETVYGNTGYISIEESQSVNMTLHGLGDRRGSEVTKGVFRSQANESSQTLTFDHRQNNGSVVFVGNTTVEKDVTQFSDGFEDGDLSEYTVEPWNSGASVSITNTRSYNGTYSVEGTESDHVNAFYTSDKKDFGPGKTFSGWVYIPSNAWSDFTIGIGYELSDGGTGRWVSIDTKENQLQAGDTSYDVAPNRDGLGNTSFTATEGSWYQLVVDWKENGDQLVEVRDTSGTVQANLTLTSDPESWSTYSKDTVGRVGGGGRLTSGDTANPTGNWDEFRITDKEVSIPTEDPQVTIGNTSVSHPGTLNDSEEVALDLEKEFSAGEYNTTVSVSNSTVDWKYVGNNDGRAYVSSVAVNGTTIATPDQFIAENETYSSTIPLSSGTSTVTVTTTNAGESQSIQKIRFVEPSAGLLLPSDCSGVSVFGTCVQKPILFSVAIGAGIILLLVGMQVWRGRR